MKYDNTILSEQEKQVYEQLRLGKTEQETATELDIHESAVYRAKSNIEEKIEKAHNTTHLFKHTDFRPGTEHINNHPEVFDLIDRLANSDINFLILHKEKSEFQRFLTRYYFDKATLYNTKDTKYKGLYNHNDSNHTPQTIEETLFQKDRTIGIETLPLEPRNYEALQVALQYNTLIAGIESLTSIEQFAIETNETYKHRTDTQTHPLAILAEQPTAIVVIEDNYIKFIHFITKFKSPEEDESTRVIDIAQYDPTAKEYIIKDDYLHEHFEEKPPY